MRSKAVLFDFYGTLARAESWGPSYEEILGRHGYTIDPEVRRRWSNDAVDGFEHVEQSRSRDAYVAWERERLASMVRACGVGDDDVDRLVADLHAESKTWTMAAYPETRAVLERLRERGITIVICSNWDWDLDRAVSSAGIDDLIDVQVTSAQAGARKPHPRIFRYTLDLAGLGPDEVLFVGDTWRADVEGPTAFGMRAVHVHRIEEAYVAAAGAPPPLPAGVVRVPDLTGVEELV